MASIPGNVASTIQGTLGRLEDRLLPFIRDIVDKAASGGIDIAHATAKDVLDTVTTELNNLRSTVEEHSPAPGR